MTEPAPSEKKTDAEEEPQPTLLEQMGGVSGLIYSSLPVIVFVLANSFFGLTAAIWTSVGSAVAITVLRLVRKEPLQPAISGFFGVAIAAFIAYRTGSAKGFFLFGIYASLIYCGGFVRSVVVRGLIAVLERLFSGQRAHDVLAFDVEGFFARLGLDQHLTLGRRNGLAAMVQRVRNFAASVAGHKE